MSEAPKQIITMIKEAGEFWVRLEDYRTLEKFYQAQVPNAAPKPLKIYDIATDELKVLTQEELDEIMEQNRLLGSFFFHSKNLRDNTFQQLEALRDKKKEVCPECRNKGQRINADGKTDGCINCGRKA